VARCCVCFISDDRLLFPTLLSAIQAHAHISPELADVFIFAIEPDSRTNEVFARICESEGIQYKVIRRAVVEGETGMYSRLFLDRFVPDEYSQILYLDGDVQVGQSLDPLIRTDVGAGQFLAARDPIAISVQDEGPAARRLHEYMRNLGLSEAQFMNYFNTGVLRINREGWRQIGVNAYRFLQQKGGACQWHDQSALNAVSNGQYRPMSFRWNFPIFFRNCGVEREIAPAIYHFMSNPKPWHGSFPPWTRHAVTPYRDLIVKYQGLQPYVPRLAGWKAPKYFLQQRGKRVSELVGWRFSARRGRIMAAERDTVAVS
jgi:hypothetical protein